MFRSRILALSVLFALVATAPNAFAKVCHPKKPITCHAAHFSTAAAPAAVAATPVKAAKKAGPKPAEQNHDSDFLQNQGGIY